MNGFKTIILCADDFGLNPSVSQGILKLIHLGRLSAVSCMVNTPAFQTHAQDLLLLKNKVHIGMHFNLTEGNFLTTGAKCFGLNELLIKSHLGLIKSSLIVNEFKAQLEHFILLMGCLPDFVDGHQHVHQFPKIRPVILNFFENRLRKNGSYIRSTYPALSVPQYRFKTQILSLVGGKQLHSQLNERGISHNSYFSGIYDFSLEAQYDVLFRQWLALAYSNTLIMCHPGEDPGSSNVSLNADPIAQARVKELNYFLSDAFISDCQQHQILLSAGPES